MGSLFFIHLRKQSTSKIGVIIVRAAKMKERPAFQLMCQTDIQTIYHMQMPRWLFSDPRYSEMSLDAKVAYTFLLNRFQLSRRNGWINDYGEVFVIFPRKEMAAELRICEQRVSAAFRRLAELKLIWEKRCGRGDANQIYLARVEPQENPSYSSAPFLPANDVPACGSRTAEIAPLDAPEQPAPSQEPPNQHFQSGENEDPKTADSDVAEPQFQCPSHMKYSHMDGSDMKVSLYAGAAPGRDGPAEDAELMEILESCELETFSPETARVFENAIERLFYSDSFRIGNATLPKSRVRSRLQLLDAMILREAEGKLRANQSREVKNSTAYTMSVIFNCITESESDLLVDPYLNSIAPGGGEGHVPVYPAKGGFDAPSRSWRGAP